MLNENIKSIRKSKGLSQADLALRLNVVRQTVSKWEQGLSVPDSEMLIVISEVLETPVSILLGESVTEQKADDIKVLAEKLEGINLQLAQGREKKRKALHWMFFSLCMAIVILSVVFMIIQSPYLGWNFNDPETAVVGTFFHAFEWCFVRLAPLLFIGTIAGMVLTRKKSHLS